MARFNTALTSSIISGTATIGTPYSGAFTDLTGTAPYTVTLPSPTLFPGVNQTFYNSTSGQITLSVSGAAFVGTGATGASTFVLNSGNVVSLFSNGTNYVVISEDGSPLTATTGSFSGNVTINGGSATLSATPQTITLNPTGASTIDNINIGATTRGSGAFNTLTANQAVTFTANTASSSTTTGSLVVTGGIGASGTIYAGAFNGNLTGTLQIAAQANITSVGILTGLVVDTDTIYVDSTNHRLGVGTGSPIAKLDVAAITNTNANIIGGTVRIRDTTSASSPSPVAGMAGLAFTAAPGTDFVLGKYWTGTTSLFVLKQGGTALGTNLVVIDINGKLGIGITPIAQLHVTNPSYTNAALTYSPASGAGDYSTLRGRVDGTYGWELDQFGSTYVGGNDYPQPNATALVNVVNGPLFLGTNNTSRLTISATGLVGIGTLSPTAKFTISSSTTDESTIHITQLNTSGGKNGSIVWRGYYNGTTTLHDSVGISRVNTDDGNSSSYNNSLVFYTRPPGVGQALSARMYINSAGSVGIDTDGPTAKLSVKATEGATGGIRLEHSAGNGPLVNIYQSGSDGQLDLYTGNSPTILRTHISSYGDSYFNAAASGKVGISTSDPKTTLSINSPSHISPGQTDGRILNWYGVTGGTEIWNSSHSISVGNNSADTAQPQHVGLSLFNANATDNIWSPAITFGGLSTSGSYMNGTAAIATKLPNNAGDNNFRGGVLHFFTQGTTAAQRGLTSKMALSANALALSTELYSTYVRTYQTIDGGSQSVRFCEDNLGRWIVVGKFAADARTAIQGTWGSVRGLSTSTSQSDATAFSADFGNSFPTEVRIMGSTNFDYWKENRTIDFVYRVPSGRTWATFFNNGNANGDSLMSVIARYGWKVNGGYDGFGRWNNPNLTDIGMSDTAYTNPSTAYSTPTASAFNWHTAQDAKLSIIHTGTYSGQDSSTTSAVGADDSLQGFLDVFPSTVANMSGVLTYSSAVWVMIKLD
jgi:hypothetical protein